ncbi:MAG: FAD-dependent oxidoreductase [Metallosphaera sp.]
MRTFHKYLIIGSGVSGYHAFEKLHESNQDVVMITNDKEIPYDRPPLSKEYMRGEIDRSSLFFKPYEAYGGKVILGVMVERLQNSIAFLNNGDEIEFEKALIATGGSPRKLDLKGEKVRYLRTLEDADNIKRLASTAKTALIVGAGFIGMEVASSLTKLGIKVDVVEVKPYIWSTFVDERVSRYFQGYFEKRGVNFILNESVKGVEEREKIRVYLSDGRELVKDFVLVATGIAPNVEVAEKSGIATRNGILVNERLETNQTNVYASGDVANIEVKGKRRRIEHWNNAMYTGELAARNMMGSEENYDFLSTVWSDIFDLHIESAGETSGYDEYVVKGDMSKDSFSVIYVKDKAAIGYVAVNRPEEELDRLNSMVKDGASIKD